MAWDADSARRFKADGYQCGCGSRPNRRLPADVVHPQAGSTRVRGVTEPRAASEGSLISPAIVGGDLEGTYWGLSESCGLLLSGADPGGSSSSPLAKIFWSCVPNRRRTRPRLTKANGNLSLASSARRRCSIAFS